VPAFAAAALLLLAALQVGWSRPLVLPPPDAITPVRLTPPSLLPVSAPPSARMLFNTGPASSAGAQPLEGAKAVGTVVRGGRALAFIQAADGRVAALAPGQAFAGWQLVGIGRDAVHFRRGGEIATLPIGAGPASTTTAGADR
jgi:hypothetical protein